MGGIFLAGVCQLETGSVDAAAARFKQIVDWKRPSTSAIYAVSPLYYGRALAKLGRIDESRAAYQKFLAAFRNADSALPIVVAAKKELARLKPAA
jgi:tetratricopeptide (TPR) repeat protein